MHQVNLFFTKVVCGRTDDGGIEGGSHDELFVKVRNQSSGETNSVIIEEEISGADSDGNNFERYFADKYRLIVVNTTDSDQVVQVDFNEDDNAFLEYSLLGSVEIVVKPNGHVEYNESFLSEGPAPGSPFKDAFDGYMFHLTGGGSRYWVFLSAKVAFNIENAQKVYQDTSFTWEKSKLVAGNFIGGNKDQIAILYRNGTDHISLSLCYQDNDHSVPFYPEKVYEDTSFTWESSKLVAGDFKGTGKDQIAILYTDQNGTVTLWLFSHNDTGFQREQIFEGSWDMNNFIEVVGNFLGGNKDKIAVFYNYLHDRVGLWMLEKYE